MAAAATASSQFAVDARLGNLSRVAAVATALKVRFADVRDEDWRRYFGSLTAISIGPAGDVTISLDDRMAPGFGAIA